MRQPWHGKSQVLMRVCTMFARWVFTMPGDIHPLMSVSWGARPTPGERLARAVTQRVRSAGPRPCPSTDHPVRGPGAAAAPPGVASQRCPGRARGGPGAALPPRPCGTAAGAGPGSGAAQGSGEPRAELPQQDGCGQEGAALPVAPELEHPEPEHPKPEHPEPEHPGGVSRLLVEGGGRSGCGVFFSAPAPRPVRVVRALGRALLLARSRSAGAARSRCPALSGAAPTEAGPGGSPAGLGSRCAPWNSSRRSSPVLLLRGSILRGLPVLRCNQGRLVFTSV